jgi:hypothetical protein
LGPNHNSTSKKLFLKSPLNLEEPRQTFFSGLFPFPSSLQIGETFNNTKPFERRAIKTPLANLSTTLTSSLPTGLFGQSTI